MRTSASRFATLVGVLAAFALMTPLAAQADSQTWTGGSITNGNLSNGQKWAGGLAPGSTSVLTNSDVATFNGPIVNGWGSAGNPVVIDSATQNIGGISFDAAADSYLIGGLFGGPGGNSLLLTSGGSIQILNT